jgi:biopolymer transport protein ExbD
MQTSGPSEDVISGINVTPLVDVILVVLIIFMVSAPIIARREITVAIPEAAHHQLVATKSLTIIVDTNKEMFLASRRVNDRELADQLRTAVLDQSDLHVTLSADKALSYGEIVRILDVVRGAGVRHIGLEVSPH